MKDGSETHQEACGYGRDRCWRCSGASKSGVWSGGERKSASVVSQSVRLLLGLRYAKSMTARFALGCTAFPRREIGRKFCAWN